MGSVVAESGGGAPPRAFLVLAFVGLACWGLQLDRFAAELLAACGFALLLTRLRYADLTARIASVLVSIGMLALAAYLWFWVA
jgi:hypothetical protein